MGSSLNGTGITFSNATTLSSAPVTSITAGTGLTGGTITTTGTIAADVSTGGIGSFFIGVSTTYFGGNAYYGVGTTCAGSTLRQPSDGPLQYGVGSYSANFPTSPGFGGTWTAQNQFRKYVDCCGRANQFTTLWRRTA